MNENNISSFYYIYLKLVLQFMWFSQKKEPVILLFWVPIFCPARFVAVVKTSQ